MPDLCENCHQDTYDWGIIDVVLHPNGPSEVNGSICQTCGYSPDLPRSHELQPEEKKMTSTTETINIIHLENNIRLIEVQHLDKKSAPYYVKLSPRYPEEVAENDTILITSEALGICLVRVTDPNPVVSIANSLTTAYPWAFQPVATNESTRLLTGEKDLANSIAVARAKADAKAIYEELPDNIKSLAKPEQTNDE